jgi:pimeloyl-ACP methyl ester carboxylesterase
VKKHRILVAFIMALVVLVAGPYLVPLPIQPDLAADEVAPPTGRFITVDGFQTYVEEAGPVTADAVILIHGMGGSTFSWRLTLPALADAGYRAVAMDLKGFGLSAKRYEEDYSHGAQADFIAGVMDELDIPAAVLVGHSMGGNVVAHFALRYPERVAKLVLVDAAVALDGEDSRFRLLGALVRIPPFRRAARIAMRVTLNADRVTGMLASAYRSPDAVTAEVAAGYLAPQRVKDWDLALLGILRDSNRQALPAPVSNIAAPVLIIWGEDDTWVPLAHGRRLQAAVGGSELAVIPEAGHLPMEERPAQFEQALLDFIGAG